MTIKVMGELKVMSQSKKKLILKSRKPSPIIKTVEVVLVGGTYDGSRVRVNPEMDNVQYGADMYSKLLIEDDKGHSVFFYRSVNLTDIQALNQAIMSYKQ